MTVDEQAKVVGLMKAKGFEVLEASPDGLDFQSVSSDGTLQITFLGMFPVYAKSKFFNETLSDRWAQQTFMFETFEILKAFAEFGVEQVSNNLKTEFNQDLQNGGL